MMNPPWLNDSFLAEVLQKGEEPFEDVKILKYSCEEAVASSYNFCSNLYRVTVDFKDRQKDSTQSLSLIVKTPLDSGAMKDFVLKLDLYNIEYKVYNQIFPEMFKHKNFQITPKSFFSPMKPFLVLEDLKSSGYVMVDRLKQLEFPHCQRALVSLAKFHALSVATHHKCPQLIETTGRHWCFNDEISESEQQERRGMITLLVSAMVATMETLDTCRQYVDKIKERIDSYWEKMVKIIKTRRGLTVFCHGDTSIINTMFKYADEEPIDAKLVDFQLCHFSSFALDILFFWWSSANEDVREHHMEELFEIYRQTLNETLQELNCSETVSKEDFDLEIKACAPYTLYIVSAILTPVMADPDNFLDPNELIKDCKGESEERRNHNSKYYKKVLPIVFKQLEKFPGVYE